MRSYLLTNIWPVSSASYALFNDVFDSSNYMAQNLYVSGKNIILKITKGSCLVLNSSTAKIIFYLTYSLDSSVLIFLKLFIKIRIQNIQNYGSFFNHSENLSVTRRNLLQVVILIVQQWQLICVFLPNVILISRLVSQRAIRPDHNNMIF
jgi:hypothetical protein